LTFNMGHFKLEVIASQAQWPAYSTIRLNTGHRCGSSMYVPICPTHIMMTYPQPMPLTCTLLAAHL
jgi:hypothetical protein